MIGYGCIANPSKNRTMVATFTPYWRDEPLVYRVDPGGSLATHGQPLWEAWKLEWEPLPKKRVGLVRFRR